MRQYKEERGIVDINDYIHGGVAHDAKDDRPLLLSGGGHWLEQRHSTGVKDTVVTGAAYSRPILHCADQFARVFYIL